LKKNLIFALGIVIPTLLIAQAPTHSSTIELKTGPNVTGQISKFGTYRITVNSTNKGFLEVITIPYHRIKSVDTVSFDYRGKTYREIVQNAESNRGWLGGLSYIGNSSSGNFHSTFFGLLAQKNITPEGYISFQGNLAFSITNNTRGIINESKNFSGNGNYSGFLKDTPRDIFGISKILIDAKAKVFATPAHCVLRPFANIGLGAQYFQHNFYTVRDQEIPLDASGHNYNSTISTTVNKSFRPTINAGFGLDLNLRENISFTSGFDLVYLYTNGIPIFDYERRSADGRLESHVHLEKNSFVFNGNFTAAILYRF
jgi:hypothetical protein